MAENQFKSLVHYVIYMCQDNNHQLGAVRLNKILWYSDVFAYQEYGQPITDEAYIKRQFGPVPRNILKILDELQYEGKIVILDPEFEFDTRKYISRQAPKEDNFSEKEKRLVSNIAKAVIDKSANEISELSHDLIWESASEGEEIPLYATLASRRGAITEDIIEWANEVVRNHGETE